LKPGGKLFFLEHGLSREEQIQRWQNRLNPLNKIVAVGCNLNRNIRKIIEGTGFCIERIEEFCLEKIPRTHGSMYRGIALKVE